MTGRDRRVRLDRLLVDRRLAPTVEKARALILAGSVLVADRPVDSAGCPVSPLEDVRLRKRDCPYVSRGGIKLKGALEAFGLDVRGLAVLDVGASTGGFTDCLLREGARVVYAVDVGYGQLAWSLRQDPRVVVLEKTNIRHVDGAALPAPPDMAVIDVSFISLRIVLPAVVSVIREGAVVLALVKPQFEAKREDVGKGGVVRDPEVPRQILLDLTAFCRERGLSVVGTCPSPLRGPAGNRETFLYLRV